MIRPVLVGLLASTALASLGDNSPLFRSCIVTCEQDCNSGVKSPPALHLRALLWGCHQECKYDCMMYAERVGAELGIEPNQYFGKWAFIRVLGVQEICSVLFSILNFVPHFYFFWWRSEDIFPKNFVFSPAIRFFNLIGMICWTCSTLFHIRDLWWTEFLDYTFANILLGASTVFGIARICNLREMWKLASVVFVGFLLFAAHVGYMLHHLMTTSRFPYGYNMKVAITLGITHASMWVVYGLVVKRKYGWKASVAAGSVILLSILEIFDFPPVFGFLDAHALWHLSTAPLSLIFYDYLLDDLRHELKLERVQLATRFRASVRTGPSAAEVQSKRA